MTTVARTVRPSGWSFLAWTAVGAGLCVAALTPFTIGAWVVLATAGAGLALLARRAGRNASAAGLVCGVGLVALWVSLMNQDGPGEVCTATATGGHCVDEWNPWPWLAAGVLFVAGGIALFLWLRRRRARSGR